MVIVLSVISSTAVGIYIRMRRIRYLSSLANISIQQNPQVNVIHIPNANHYQYPNMNMQQQSVPVYPNNQQQSVPVYPNQAPPYYAK